MLLPQDLYVLSKLACISGEWTFRGLSDELFLSTSQIHAALRRAKTAGLYLPDRKRLNRLALEEFIIHGVKYSFAVERGGLSVGLPTSFAAPPLSKNIVCSADTIVPVWTSTQGNQKGYAIEPLHPAAPQAAFLDKNFYEFLALIDGLREGRARERKLAAAEIQRRLSNRRAAG